MLKKIILWMVIVSFALCGEGVRVYAGEPAVSIILSPHFDDADLSLGGFISQHKGPIVVATFFAGKPSVAVSKKWDRMSGFQNSAIAIASRIKENDQALAGTEVANYGYLDFQYRAEKRPATLQASIESDIEKLIQSRSAAAHVDIYGPSAFIPTVTHPDHLIVHDAFYAEALKHAGDPRLSFYAYEDFPYVYHFGKATTTPLSAHLHRLHPQSTFVPETISLSSQDVLSKESRIAVYVSQIQAFSRLHEKVISSSKKFMAQRCGKEGLAACEVVYRIVPVVSR
jgi:LmbE family N-acetylglucosaminyl deacetylase